MGLRPAEWLQPNVYAQLSNHRQRPHLPRSACMSAVVVAPVDCCLGSSAGEFVGTAQRVRYLEPGHIADQLCRIGAGHPGGSDNTGRVVERLAQGRRAMMNWQAEQGWAAR